MAVGQETWLSQNCPIFTPDWGRDGKVGRTQSCKLASGSLAATVNNGLDSLASAAVR